MELGESLRAARQMNKMKGVQVAGAIGITSAAYLRYERGEVTPPATTIMKLAELYGCSETDLLRHGGGQTGGRTPEKKVAINLPEGSGAVTLKITIEIEKAS